MHNAQDRCQAKPQSGDDERWQANERIPAKRRGRPHENAAPTAISAAIAVPAPVAAFTQPAGEGHQVRPDERHRQKRPKRFLNALL